MEEGFMPLVEKVSIIDRNDRLLHREDDDVTEAIGQLGSVVSHTKAGRDAARFRLGTTLLPNLVLSEDKTTAAVG
jgi:hypothetical protein